MIYSQNGNVDPVKALAHNIAFVLGQKNSEKVWTK